MSDRITEDQVPAPLVPLTISFAGEIPLLDGSIPLIRDEEWIWYAVLYDDANTPTDLAGKTVTAELRWTAAEQAVTVEPVVDAPGQVKLSVAAEDTAAMPYGQLLTLYLAVDGISEGAIPVTVMEGYAS